MKGTESPLFHWVEIETIKDKVKGWIEEKFINEPQYFFVDAKVQGRKLSVFVEGDNGVTIDKCAELSRYLEKYLDEEKPLGENYILEVSSPGIDNSFKTRRQYSKAMGKEVAVVKFDGQKIIGILENADEEKVVVGVVKKIKGMPDEIQVNEIPFTDIKSTKINLNF